VLVGARRRRVRAVAERLSEDRVHVCTSTGRA
jgi:hypothetical protein